MSWNATRNGFALEHNNATDSPPTQFDGCRKACGPGADYGHIDFGRHRLPIQSLIARPDALAASAHTLAAQ